MGSLSQTKYILHNCPPRIKVTHRHHPLVNQELEVLKADKVNLIVRMADGSALRMPRSWTNADGDRERNDSLASLLTLETLRELMELIDALQRRR